MITRKPPIKVVPGQIWADTDPRDYGHHVRVVEVNEVQATVVSTVPNGWRSGRPSRVLYDEHGLRDYRLVSQPEEN